MIVVDTHVWIWDALAPERLSAAASEALVQANQGDGLLVADISLWEIAMLVQKQRVQVATDVRSFLTLLLEANPVTLCSITASIAARSVQLSALVNADPADRLIAATALVHELPLVTADHNLRSVEGLATIW